MKTQFVSKPFLNRFPSRLQYALDFHGNWDFINHNEPEPTPASTPAPASTPPASTQTPANPQPTVETPPANPEPTPATTQPSTETPAPADSGNILVNREELKSTLMELLKLQPPTTANEPPATSETPSADQNTPSTETPAANSETPPATVGLDPSIESTMVDLLVTQANVPGELKGIIPKTLNEANAFLKSEPYNKLKALLEVKPAPPTQEPQKEPPTDTDPKPKGPKTFDQITTADLLEFDKLLN